MSSDEERDHVGYMDDLGDSPQRLRSALAYLNEKGHYSTDGEAG